MDLWESSHRNSYTRAALQCKVRIIQAGKIRARLDEFLPYTKSGTSDYLCVEAFKCIMQLFTVRNSVVLPYFQTVMSTDRSPYVRDQLFQIFGVGLATVAMGLDRPASTSKGELTIDEDASGNERQSDAKRKMTVEGAVEGLRQDLKTDKVPQKQASPEALRHQISDFETSSTTVSAGNKKKRSAVQQKIESTHGEFYYDKEASEPLHSALWTAVTYVYSIQLRVEPRC